MTDADTAKTPPPSPLKPEELGTLSLRLDERGRLFLVRPGEEDLHVIARRAFPWSMPGQFVSLRTKDGNEVALIESLEQVPAPARETLLSAIAAGTFIPRITRIGRINMEHGYQLWQVETEAGPIELRVQEREDIRFLSDVRYSVKDANGNVYEITDVNALDEPSRRELGRVV